MHRPYKDINEIAGIWNHAEGVAYTELQKQDPELFNALDIFYKLYSRVNDRRGWDQPNSFSRFLGSLHNGLYYSEDVRESNFARDELTIYSGAVSSNPSALLDALTIIHSRLEKNEGL